MPLRFHIPFILTIVTATAAAEREVTFEHDVRPILKAHCTSCHGEEEKPKGGVDLRLRRIMDKETEDGDHVVLPGKPGANAMVRLIRAGEMAEKGKQRQPYQARTVETPVAPTANNTK